MLFKSKKSNVMAIRDIERLRQMQTQHRQKLNQIVHDALKEEKLLSDHLYEEEEKLSFSERMADRIAEFGGSWKFIGMFLGIVTIWVTINLLVVSLRWDPYPFILMNLFLSAIAAL